MSVDFTPEDLAEVLFTEEPKEPNSCMLDAEIIGELDGTISDIHQILLTVMMEGIIHLQGSIANIDRTNFSMDYLYNLNPWFKSIGYKLLIGEYTKDDTKNHNDYYSKILLNDSLNEGYFIMKNINKDYSFVINYKNYNRQYSKLSDMYSIFENNGKIYTISFDNNY